MALSLGVEENEFEAIFEDDSFDEPEVRADVDAKKCNAQLKAAKQGFKSCLEKGNLLDTHWINMELPEVRFLNILGTS